MNFFNYPHEWCGLPRFVIKLETSLLNWIFVSKANYTRTNCQQSSNVDRPRRQSWVVRANSNQRPRQNIWTRAGFASRSLNWPLPFRPIWGHGTRMIQPASNVASGFCASHCDCSLAPSPDTWERKRKIRLRETERERRCFSITSESGWRRWVGWRFFIACTSKNRLPRDDTELPPQQSKWPRCYPVRGWEKLLWGGGGGGGYDVLARTVA